MRRQQSGTGFQFEGVRADEPKKLERDIQQLQSGCSNCRRDERLFAAKTDIGREQGAQNGHGEIKFRDGMLASPGGARADHVDACTSSDSSNSGKHGKNASKATTWKSKPEQGCIPKCNL